MKTNIAFARKNVVELVGFEGLGHRKILYAPPVVRCASTYLMRQQQLISLSPSGAQRKNPP